MILRNVVYRASDEEVISVLEEASDGKVVYFMRHNDASTGRFNGRISCTLSTRKSATKLLAQTGNVSLFGRPFFVSTSSSFLAEFASISDNEIVNPIEWKQLARFPGLSNDKEWGQWEAWSNWRKSLV